MDQVRFEILARSVAQAAERAATDRRTALRLLLGGALAAAFGRYQGARAADVGAGSAIVPGCKLPGQKCKNNDSCCGTSKCRGSKRCGCVNKGGSCFVETGKNPITGEPIGIMVRALCCTAKCHKHDHKCR